MNRPFENIEDVQKKLYDFRSTKDLYFKIFNLLYVTTESAQYYRLSGLYGGCASNDYYNYDGYNCYKLCQMRNFYYNFEFIFLRLSSELYEYCSMYEDCKKIKSKPAELVKKASEIFSESDEKEEIFEYAKVAYLE